MRRWVELLDTMASEVVSAAEGGLIDLVVDYDDLVGDPVGIAASILTGEQPGLAERVGGWLGRPEAKRTGEPLHGVDVGDASGLTAYDRYFGFSREVVR